MSALSTSPWRRAPWLLLVRSPGVFAAVLIATAVLSTAAASAALFLASTATAALHNEAALSCPEASQPAITDEQGPAHYASAAQAPRRLTAINAAVRGAMDQVGLGDVRLVATSTVALQSPTQPAFLLYRVDARAHVRALATRPGRGVWIPRSYATAHRLSAGSMMAMGGTRVAVTGVYRDLAPSAFVPLFHLERYWCSWQDSIVPTPFSRPPPMFLTDLVTLRRASTVVDATWYDTTPITTRTVPNAAAALAAATRAAGRLPRATFHVQTQLGSIVAKAERTRIGLRGPVVPIAIAGSLVAALLVAASGAYWGLRRARELRLLRSRGVGRTAIGAKAVLEALPAVLAGSVIGWLAAIGLVRTVGPSALLEPGAPLVALRLALLAGGLALVAVAVTGARTVAGDAKRRARSWSRGVPWEFGLVAAAAVAYARLRGGGGVRIVKATVQLDPMVIAFPLLALTGAVLLLGRLQWITLRRRAISPRLPTAGYLAARRLVGTPAVAIGVLVGIALPISVLVYSSALVGSTRADLQAKYETNVGADYAFGTLAAAGSTPRTGAAATIVSMIQVDPRTDDGTAVRVLGLDPDTFASFAFQGAQLRSSIDRLRGGGRVVRALLVNAPATARVASVTIRSATVPIEVVARRASFPGLRDPYEPLLVVDRSRLPRLDQATDRTEEMWTSTESVGAALAALRRDGVDANYQITPQTFLDNTGLRPVTWLFGYLRALAVLTGAVALAGLSFAFTARTKRRALAYHLARRMGLTRAVHRRSLGLEVGALLALGWATGVGFAVAAVGVVYRLTDAYPNFPPPPEFPNISGVVIISVSVMAATGLAATVVLQWLVDRASVERLLRS